jgi:hypothetical protein
LESETQEQEPPPVIVERPAQEAPLEKPPPSPSVAASTPQSIPKSISQGWFKSPTAVARAAVEAPPEDPDWPNPTTVDVAYVDVREKCGHEPLELAALAKLKAWERGPADVYTLEETMQLIRWLEERLEAQPVQDSTHCWEAFIQSKRALRVQVFVAITLATLIALFFIGCITYGAFDAQIVTSLDSDSGVFIVSIDGKSRAVSTATLVTAHTLLDYPSLSTGELRRAQDMVFVTGNDFYFHRLSSITQLGETLDLTGEDGTVARVENVSVRIAPAFARPAFIDANGMKSLANARGGNSLALAGAFRAHGQVWAHGQA